jgi:non-heme chloroperoxidase
MNPKLHVQIALVISTAILSNLLPYSTYSQTKSSKMSTTISIQRTPASAGRATFIEVEKNVKLHVTDLGEGTPVVLIHGWPLSDAMYEYQYQYLIKKGCRVIGITLRGFGESDKPYGAYNYDVFADDIKTVLDRLNINNAVLGGFSMGGATALHYVAKYNGAHISKLALFGAAVPLWSNKDGFEYGSPKEQIDQLIALNNTNRPKLLAVFGGIFTATDNSLPAEFGNWLNFINLQASSYAMEQCLILLRDADLRPELSQIQVPTAIFHGKKDKICQYGLAGVMQKGIKNAYTVTFENSGHALFLEEMEKFNAELLAFIQK